MHFSDRKEAGEKLGELLAKQYKDKAVVVFGLPRGGVVTAYEVAKILHVPLSVIIVRKIGHPMEPEYAVGAISEHGHLIVNEEEVASINKEWLEKVVKIQQEEIRKREVLYNVQKEKSMQGKIALIVDDGIATGLTIRAAIADIKDLHPSKIIVAVPVLPLHVAKKLKEEVDDVVALDAPEDFLGGISGYYENFPQVSSEEVVVILSVANKAK